MTPAAAAARAPELGQFGIHLGRTTRRPVVVQPIEHTEQPDALALTQPIASGGVVRHGLAYKTWLCGFRNRSAVLRIAATVASSREKVTRP